MLKLSEQDIDYPRDSYDDCTTTGDLRRSIAKLPEVVQKYMTEALFLQLHNKGTIDYDDGRRVPIARSLRIEQEGTFLLNKKWIPFNATQEFSACPRHPGFVWDAVMKTKFMPVYVRDAYIEGVGIMKAQLPGGIPVVNMMDTLDLNMGELMRWLAEAALFPLALVPTIKHKSENDEDPTVLKWVSPEEGCDDCAAVEIKHHNTVAKVYFHFDPTTHMITKIHAKRPRAVGDKTEMTHWEGYLFDYEIHGGLVVPTRMEAGWRLKDDEPVELYFRGKNSSFIYLMNNGERHAIQTAHAHTE